MKSFVSFNPIGQLSGRDHFSAHSLPTIEACELGGELLVLQWRFPENIGSIYRMGEPLHCVRIAWHWHGRLHPPFGPISCWLPTPDGHSAQSFSQSRRWDWFGNKPNREAKRRFQSSASFGSDLGKCAGIFGRWNFSGPSCQSVQCPPRSSSFWNVWHWHWHWWDHSGRPKATGGWVAPFFAMGDCALKL